MAVKEKNAPFIGDDLSLERVLGRLSESILILEKEGQVAYWPGAGLDSAGELPAGYRMAGYLPPLPLKNLGDPSFCRDHRLRFPYVAGGMANGIASVELVEAMARAGMLGFYGAAGQDLAAIEKAIDRFAQDIPNLACGFNLIHSPSEPEREAATVSLYLRRGIHLVEAAAYLQLTLPLVRYRVAGIARDAEGRILTPNRVIGKVSRVEVATPFFSPPPEEMLNELVRTREITADQAQWASRIPMAQDITAEADSAGHTDNRPLVTLLPTMLSLRHRQQQRYNFVQSLRVGAGGGLSTPSALAAASSMGAAFLVTGSINQSCVESGSCETVRRMLSEAGQADTTMAPAADMFEMGVKVQVLKRGTMFPMRAAKLYDLYRAYPALEALPENERAGLEKQYFRASLESVWRGTRDYFLKRDARQIERAEREPKHKMALVFRSYLGQSSRWANAGEPSRVLDYQIWCGPAMGAFNEWAKGTFLEKPENRRVALVALNLLHGAGVQLRAQALRSQGFSCPARFLNCPPLDLNDLQKILHSDE